MALPKFIFTLLFVTFLIFTPALSQEEKLLLVHPFLGRPTPSSITMNLAAAKRNIVAFAKYKKENPADSNDWQKTHEVSVRANKTAELQLTSLQADTAYRYELYGHGPVDMTLNKIADGTFRTQRTKTGPFSFALLSDSHIEPFTRDRVEVLQGVSKSILSRRPEFVMMLGDNIQTFTSYGGPLGQEEHGPLLYLTLRFAMGPLPSQVPVFGVVGNWEGENGWHPGGQRQWAKNARKAHIPNPDAKTYPEGGNTDQDYYGFTWGNVLCLVLNVLSYTPKDHTFNSGAGRADEWTLGERQKNWLYEQLSGSKAKWKFIFLHHTAGGNAGDDQNSRYGRGGGRAAKVGEQALIHTWMSKFGVQALFYGHDHVFTDMTVDGIHYTCVGSAGGPWKFDRSLTGYEKWWEPSGYAWVDVEEDIVRISFVHPDKEVASGITMHSFSISPR